MSQISITREMQLPEILALYPGCRPVFDRYGLVGYGGPLGPRESLAFFARAHRVDETQLLRELEEAFREVPRRAHRPLFIESRRCWKRHGVFLAGEHRKLDADRFPDSYRQLLLGIPVSGNSGRQKSSM